MKGEMSGLHILTGYPQTLNYHRWVRTRALPWAFAFRAVGASSNDTYFALSGLRTVWDFDPRASRFALCLELSFASKV
jgi:hypothetical protein